MKGQAHCSVLWWVVRNLKFWRLTAALERINNRWPLPEPLLKQRKALEWKLRPYIEKLGFTTGNILLDGWIILDTLKLPPGSPSKLKFHF